MTDSDSTDGRALAPARAASVAVTQGRPNPQGKGVVGFLQDWAYSSPQGIVAKRPAQLLADYFTSLLVLSSSFRFKPVFEREYFLYRDDGDWTLSLISPEEWGNADRRRRFVGTCVLHQDSTWSIDPSDNIGAPGPVTDALAAFYDAFLRKLDTRRALEDELPVYVPRLAYYQRLFAAALSRSVRASLLQGGQLAIPSERWLADMPADALRLLASETQSR